MLLPHLTDVFMEHSRVQSLEFPANSLDGLHAYDIKYYPYANNSQLYTALQDSSPETLDPCNQLSTWHFHLEV